MRAAALLLVCTIPMALALTRPAPRNDKLAEYKSWKLVTPKPLNMDPALAQLCAPPVKGIATAHTDSATRYFRVYVNDTGEKAMLGGGTFPTGSIIVKQKLVQNAQDYKVELLTVMVKRQSGFDRKANDWDFYVTDPSGTRITAPKKIENCVSCHQSAKAQDLVFRTYVKAD